MFKLFRFVKKCIRLAIFAAIVVAAYMVYSRFK